MAIKFKAKSKEEIPSELQSLYVEREGGFVLDVEGAVEKSKVEEVRGTNAALLKERDELRKPFDGIDPNEARKLFEKQALQAGEIEKVIEGRVRVLKGDLEKQYAGVAAERDGLNARLKSLRSLCSPRLCVYLFASIFLPFTSSLPSFPFCSIF